MSEDLPRGFGAITQERPAPRPQTSSSGALSSGGGRGGRPAPPRTPFRKRKVGDRVWIKDKAGIIMEIRTNGHERYRVFVPGIGSRWLTELEVD